MTILYTSSGTPVIVTTNPDGSLKYRYLSGSACSSIDIQDLEACQCPTVYDCPDIQKNIGDPCDDPCNSDCFEGKTIQCDCTCGGGTLIANDCIDPATVPCGVSITSPSGCHDCQSGTGLNISQGRPDLTPCGEDVLDNCGNVIIAGGGQQGCFSCPALSLNIGDPCSSGDPCVSGETVQPDCTCGGGTAIPNDCPDPSTVACGQPIVSPSGCHTCTGTGTMGIGDPCDDGNPCTTGSTIQTDCSCGGGVAIPPDNSCAATTCVGETCTDACGNVINGTLIPTMVTVSGTMITSGAGDIIVNSGSTTSIEPGQPFTGDPFDLETADGCPDPVEVISLIGFNDSGVDFHDENGSFSISGAGGTLTPNIANGGYDMSLTQAGTFTITWTADSPNANCEIETASWTVIVLPCPGAACSTTIDSINVTNPTCTGTTLNVDGTITINATLSNGTGSLEYSIDNGSTFQASNSFTGLAGGNYQIVVRDDQDNTCSDSDSATLVDPNCAFDCNTVTIDPNPNVTNAECATDGDTGSVDFNPSGGTGPYVVTGDLMSINNPTVTVGNYQGLITDSNGCTATYNVDVLDDNNCPDPCDGVNIDANETVVDETCNANNTADGEINFAPSGGTAPYTVTGDLTSLTNTGLSEGNYQGVITDDNGCTVNYDITIADEGNCPPPGITAGDDDFDIDPDNNFGQGTPGTAYPAVDVTGLAGFSNTNGCAGPFVVTLTAGAVNATATVTGTNVTVTPDTGLSDGDSWSIPYEVCCAAPNGAVCDTGLLEGTVRVVAITDPCDMACTPSLSFLAVDQTLGTRLEVFNTSLAPAPLVTDITMVPATTLTYNSSTGVGLTGLVVHTYDSPSNILGAPPGPNSWSVNWDGLTTVHNLGNSPFDFATTYLEHKFANFSLANDCTANSGYTISYPVAVQQTGGTGTEFVGDTISVDWGDGSPIDNYTIGGLGDVTISHTFTTTGTFTISISHLPSNLFVTEQLRIQCQ